MAGSKFSPGVALLASSMLAGTAFLLQPVLPTAFAGDVAWAVLRALVAGGVAGMLVPRFVSRLEAAAGTAVGVVPAGLVLLAFTGAPSLGHLALAAALAPAAAFAIAALAASGTRGRQIAALGALALVCASFLWHVGVLPGSLKDTSAHFHEVIAEEPRPEAYSQDAFVFLRTYHLLEDGMGYYDAFAKAFDEDARTSGPPGQPLNVREPLVYEVWAALPGASGLSPWFAFVAISLAMIACSFLVARPYVADAAALIAAVLLASYLVRPATSLWFTMAEFWGAAFGLAAAALLVRSRFAGAAIALVLAVAAREIMGFLVPCYLTVWWLHPERRRNKVWAVLALLAPPAVLGVHLALASRVTQASSPDPSSWLGGGLGRLTDALVFSSDFVLLGPLVALLVVTLALVGAALARPPWRRALSLSLVLVPLAVLGAFGGGPYREYWGAIAMPFAIALSPLALARLLPAEEPKASTAAL